MSNPLLAESYAHCLDIARNHYENFPVASRFLHKNLRAPISVVYAFARNADDFADEGELSPSQRLAYLDNYSSELQKIELNEASHEPVFIALKDVINRYHIPLLLFHDLLQAFRTDVSKKRYQTFSDLLDYCRLSANPVGRILLYIHQSQSASTIVTDRNLVSSDAVCTGLQLINFFQDIAQDYTENRRIYLPLEDMQRFNVAESDLARKINDFNTQALMKFQLQRARTIYQQGKPLCRNLSGRFGFEIRMIYAAGDRVLHKLELHTADIYARPRLNYADKLAIIRHAILS